MKIFSVNKRAEFDYEILETIEAGIVLSGHEVKSIKSGRVNLSGAHAIIRNGGAELVGMSVPSFQPANVPEKHESERTRSLLLKKKEILELGNKLKSGLTLIPIKLYNKSGFLKILLGLGRGRKKHDKREVIKKREADREIRKFIKK